MWTKNSETLAVCLINCEVMPYLQHLGKLTFGLFMQLQLQSKGEYLVNLKVIINS